MRRLTLVLTVLLLAIGLMMAMAVSADLVYDSTINIRNMEDEPATVVIQFYDEHGNHDPAADVTMEIPGQSMAYYFVIQNEHLPEDFQGSAVVASDKELVIVHNLRVNVGEQGGATNGFTEGAPEIRLPLIMRNNGGYTTWFSVQNAGMEDAIVEVEFFASSYAGNDWKWVDPADGDNQVTIKPGAAYYFDQADMPELGNKFVGSAIVRCVNGQPLVASVVEMGPSGLFAYDGFASGSETIMAPLFHYYNAGYQSSIQIQNVGDTDTEVTVTYVPGMAGNTCTETHTIPAGASEIFGFFAFLPPATPTTPGNPDPDSTTCWVNNSAGGVGTRFIGSAYVSENSESQPLLGVVNQMNSTTKKSGAYSAYDPAAGTQCVALPLIMDRNSGYWTSIQVMNVGPSTTTVTIKYSTYKGITPADDIVTLDPNEMAAILHWDRLGGGATYVGSAVACGEPGSKIVAMVNEISSAPGDTLYVYNGFNIIPE